MSDRTRSGRHTAVIAVFIALTSGAAEAGQLIAVDWANPELVALAKQQAENPPRSLGPSVDDKLAKLKLPVLGFESTPKVVEDTFRIGPRPATERDVVVDETNPVWYQIVERYGDVTVSVEADLRIQQEFPASYPVYPTPSSSAGAAAQAGPAVSVFDEQNENGIEGLIAEYTVVKYGVPYTVTIECSQEAKDQCRDTAQIAQDSALLGLIRANVPKQ